MPIRPQERDSQVLSEQDVIGTFALIAHRIKVAGDSPEAGIPACRSVKCIHVARSNALVQREFAIIGRNQLYRHLVPRSRTFPCDAATSEVDSDNVAC